MSATDTLGDRMKRYEEAETGRLLMPRLPIYARLDGKAFHTLTRKLGCRRPYDPEFSAAMIETTRYLVERVHPTIAYVQSDEISLAWYFPDEKSQPPFGGRIFKLQSVLAGMCSSVFTLEILLRNFEKSPDGMVTVEPPAFDCRACQFPTLDECANMFLWRERDATKNAITMAAGEHYSDKELHGKRSAEKQEMLFQKGVNFNDYPAFFKRGTFLRRVTTSRILTEEELLRIPEQHRPTGPVERSAVVEIEMPPFDKVAMRGPRGSAQVLRKKSSWHVRGWAELDHVPVVLRLRLNLRGGERSLRKVRVELRAANQQRAH